MPRHWAQDRPAEIGSLRQPLGARLGATGPDLGYGLKLAKLMAERAAMSEGDDSADAVAGCFATGSRRSSGFHRAPVIYDMEWAFTLWGFLPGAPADLVAYRRPLFAGADHDYSRQRAVADAVLEEVLRLSPAEVQARLTNWRNLFKPA
jgi:hypothetical protein